MNRFWLYIGAIGALSILLVSCNDDSEKLPPVSVVPVLNPQSTAIKDSSSIAPKITVIKDRSVVAGKTLISSIPATGLIVSTNGEFWTKTVAKGRTNPFADISLQPILVVDKVTTNSTIASIEEIPVIRKLGKRSIVLKEPGNKTYIASNSPAIKSGVNKKLPRIEFGSIVAVSPIKSVKRVKPVKPNESVKPEMIPVVAIVPPRSGSKILPAPINRVPVIKSLLANTIEITGVIEIGSRSQVLVKLPNELLSRYVEVGEFIPDTMVKVNRVDTQADSTRIIVLEESGIQIFRKIKDLETSTIYKMPVVNQPSTYLFTEEQISVSDRSSQYIQVFDSNVMSATSQSIPISTKNTWIYPF